MLRDDSNQAFWKEKFINGLPNLFAHKIRIVLSNESGQINYDELTYGNIISTINQVGMKMCVDLKIGKSIQADRKNAKYELGNFCEQYGLASVPPSRQVKRSHDKRFSKSRHYSRKRNSFRNNDEFYSKRKFTPRKSKWSKGYSKGYRQSKQGQKKTDKSKVRCYKCKRQGHYANECKVKDTVKQLKLANEDEAKLIKVLELANTESDPMSSASSHGYSSDSSQSSEPKVQLGCKDINAVES